MNKRELKIAYDYINKELFDNELQDVEVLEPLNVLQMYGVAKLWDLPEFEGATLQTMDNSIYVGILTVGFSYWEQLNTLVHEMVHVWQLQNGKKADHGKEFKKWCEDAYYLFINK